MADQAAKELSQEIFSCLQKERLVLLGTVDHETKGPNVNAISWVFAPNATTVRFALDNRSRILQNIKAEPQVTLTIFAEESVFSISGNAQVVEELMEGIPIKLAMVEVLVTSVRNVMFYGSKIAQEPIYEKTYNPEAAKKLDNQVMEGLKKA